MAANYFLGLVGYPLEHSLSPEIHQAALEWYQLSGSYELFAIPPTNCGNRELIELLESIRSGNFHGLNITIPYKRSVINLVDELTPIARSVGAVNTIYNRAGKLIGDNTDAAGFLNDIKGLAYRCSDGLEGFVNPENNTTVLILGAGGGARAVSYALATLGWDILISSRRPAQAKQLIKDMREPGCPGTFRSIAHSRDAIMEILPSINLIINATPVGMFPEISKSPWPTGMPFPEKSFVYDLIYNPPESRLLRESRSAGLPCANGLGMLVEQAAKAFELWTGLSAPRKSMRAAVMGERIE